MKAVAFSNNDIAVAAWTFGGRIAGCLGFAIYRTDIKAGVETCLPALATFPGETATAGRTTDQDPVQKFFWKDVYAKRGGSYSYRIVPMTGKPEALIPMSIGSRAQTSCNSHPITEFCRRISIEASLPLRPPRTLCIRRAI
jgi:hypothetical protein